MSVQLTRLSIVDYGRCRSKLECGTPNVHIPTGKVISHCIGDSWLLTDAQVVVKHGLHICTNAGLAEMSQKVNADDYNCLQLFKTENLHFTQKQLLNKFE